MRLFVVGLALALVTLARAANLKATVVDVLSGDVLVVKLDGVGTEDRETIRLAGIDCDDREYGVGDSAWQESRSLVLAEVVDIETFGKDSVGRILGRLHFPRNQQKLDLAESLLARGLATTCPYTGGSAMVDSKYKLTEDAARKSKMGMWASTVPTLPWEARKAKTGGNVSLSQSLQPWAPLLGGASVLLAALVSGLLTRWNFTHAHRLQLKADEASDARKASQEHAARLHQADLDAESDRQKELRQAGFADRGVGMSFPNQSITEEERDMQQFLYILGKFVQRDNQWSEIAKNVAGMIPTPQDGSKEVK